MPASGAFVNTKFMFKPQAGSQSKTILRLQVFGKLRLQPHGQRAGFYGVGICSDDSAFGIQED